MNRLLLAAVGMVFGRLALAAGISTTTKTPGRRTIPPDDRHTQHGKTTIPTPTTDIPNTGTTTEPSSTLSVLPVRTIGVGLSCIALIASARLVLIRVWFRPPDASIELTRVRVSSEVRPMFWFLRFTVLSLKPDRLVGRFAHLCQSKFSPICSVLGHRSLGWSSNPGGHSALICRLTGDLASF